MDGLSQLATVVAERQQHPQEGSYTCYLFAQGLDKILKKIGEEASEVIIAAKNGDNTETIGEVVDLLYHLMVLLQAQGIAVSEVNDVLAARATKIGNLKPKFNSEKES